MRPMSAFNQVRDHKTLFPWDCSIEGGHYFSPLFLECTIVFGGGGGGLLSWLVSNPRIGRTESSRAWGCGSTTHSIHKYYLPWSILLVARLRIFNPLKTLLCAVSVWQMCWLVLHGDDYVQLEAQQTAEVFEEFVASFEDIGSSGKTFVRGSTSVKPVATGEQYARMCFVCWCVSKIRAVCGERRLMGEEINLKIYIYFFMDKILYYW